MVISRDNLTFERHRRVPARPIRLEDNECLLELDRDLGDGRFMRFGPINDGQYSSDREVYVTFYKSLELAVAPREKRYSNSSCSGVYFRHR